MIIRGAMDKQTPYGEVSVGDIFYFIENNGDGLIRAAAEVDNVFTSGQLTEEESIVLPKKASG